ncbi:hypothetical protein OAR33_00230 [bacterium]|nr:hypothetical protein [bacterium]MDC0991980.1 hypothetical protein [bacterium]
MKRRRASGTAVSFFAFQDVMLGVIGVIILITIMLLIQRTTAALEPPMPTLPGPIGRDQDDVPVVERIVTIETTATERADRRRRIRASAESLEQSEARLVELRNRFREILDDRLLSSVANRLRASLENQESLAKELRELKRRNRVTYLLTEADGPPPLILELSDNRAVISRDSGSSGSFSITGRTPEETAERVATYAEADLDRANDEYLLLVIKPSGIGLWAALLRHPRISGLPIGIDLIPEHASTTESFPGGDR